MISTFSRSVLRMVEHLAPGGARWRRGESGHGQGGGGSREVSVRGGMDDAPGPADDSELAVLGSRHLLLRAEEHAGELARNAERYLPALLSAGDEIAAARVYQDVCRLWPHYRPRDPRIYEPLARGLRAGGRPAHAVALAGGFCARFPGDERLVGLSLLVARVLREDLGREDLASAALRLAAMAFPRHPQAAEVRVALAGPLGGRPEGSAPTGPGARGPEAGADVAPR